MDPQIVSPAIKEKQAKTAISLKTRSIMDQPSKEPKTKPSAEPTMKTTQETSKMVKTQEMSSKRNVEELSAFSPNKKLPSAISFEKPNSKHELIKIIKQGNPEAEEDRKNEKNSNDHTNGKKLEKEAIKKELVRKNRMELNTEKMIKVHKKIERKEPISTMVFPFSFDQKCITFLGRIGDEPVPAFLEIRNSTKFPYMFKVKCSNNSLFKIKPIFGFLDAMCVTDVTVTYCGSHIPPVYHEWISVHSMMPDPLCPNICKAFKRRNSYECRSKILVDFAYHEEAVRLMGDRNEKVFNQLSKAINANRALIKRRKKEMKKRLEENLIEKSPRRSLEFKREKAKEYYEKQKEKKEWMKKLPLDGEKPVTKFDKPKNEGEDKEVKEKVETPEKESKKKKKEKEGKKFKGGMEEKNKKKA